MRFLILFLSISLVLIYISSAEAIDIHNQAGTSSFDFLKIEPGARPAGMGNAFTAIANDGNCLYWNPAGLTQLENKQFTTTYVNYLVDVKGGLIGYTEPLNDKYSFGFGAVYWSSGSIERRTATGGDNGEFGASDVALMIVLSRRFNEHLSLGASLKGIYSTIDQWNANGFAIDLGALYWFDNGISLGLSMQNAGLQTRAYIEEKYPLPLVIRSGLAYSKSGGTLALEVKKPRDNFITLAIGGEYWVQNLLAFRSGYNTHCTKLKTGESNLEDYAGLTFGLSARYSNLQIDYAYVPYAALGNCNRFSLIANF